MLKFTILGVLLMLGWAVPDNQYCNLKKCKKGPHTMCNPKIRLCPTLINRGVSEQEKQIILKTHHYWRKYLADGREVRGLYGKPQPPARNMVEKLTWDDEVAKIAQRWADNCEFEHDQCRNTLDDVPVGQNLAEYCTTGDPKELNVTIVEQLTLEWYEEVKDFDAELISHPFRGGKSANGNQTGHFTQFAWATTRLIGCGIVRYVHIDENGKNWKTILLVCNYKPAGNMLNDMIYLKG